MKDYRWRVSGSSDACRRQADLITEMSAAQNMGADDEILNDEDFFDVDESTLREMIAANQKESLLKKSAADPSAADDASLQWAWQEGLFDRQGSR